MDVTAHQAEHLWLFYLSLGRHKNTLFHSTNKTDFHIALRLPNNESATYITSGNNFLRNHCSLRSAPPPPPSPSLALSPFLFYSFSLIVCNSYQVSLRPTSVASNSAVGKPSVCCRHFIGFQGGGLLLFSVILARQ